MIRLSAIWSAQLILPFEQPSMIASCKIKPDHDPALIDWFPQAGIRTSDAPHAL